MTPETFDRLDPTTELERLLEQAEARVDQLTDQLALRSAALDRTAATNDRMRATLARVEALLPRWERTRGGVFGEAHRMDLRAALDDQETPSE